MKVNDMAIATAKIEPGEACHRRVTAVAGGELEIAWYKAAVHAVLRTGRNKPEPCLEKRRTGTVYISLVSPVFHLIGTRHALDPGRFSALEPRPVRAAALNATAFFDACKYLASLGIFLPLVIRAII
ncbi:hypothetical protein CCMA1212_003443 [Trichoderma ghanense]|uniref:Uncharacterized protein n=1 Tax=Trichoderma ghanense TaxID=65468 RepID=A0ABY2H935_9HYPO